MNSSPSIRIAAPLLLLCAVAVGCHESGATGDTDSTDARVLDAVTLIDTVVPDTEPDSRPDADGQTTQPDDANGDSAAVDAADTSTEDTEADAEIVLSPVETALVAAGFHTTPGAVFSFRTTDCTGLASCFFANPTSPYLLFALPQRPDEPPVVDEPFDSENRPDGMHTAWRLAPDEVVVVVGHTPPEAAYFSFAHYLYSHLGPEGRTTIFGPLGDALNQQTLERTSESPFDAPFAIVMGSDETLLRAAAAAIAEAEPGHAIDRLTLDPSQLELGLTDLADTFMLLGRIALFADEAVGDSWLSEPPISIYRAAFDEPYDHSTAERVPFTVPRSEPVEAVTSSDVDRVETALRDALPEHQFQILTFPALNYFDVYAEQQRCLPELINCQGMVGDTVYARTNWRSLEDGQMLVAIGVNHEASGKATYSSVAAVSRSALVSTVAFDSRSMPTTTASVGLDGPDTDALFVVAFARSCEGIDLPCEELNDVAPDDEVALLFRAYLEPGAGVAPAAATLTPPRAWRAVPR